MKTKLEQALDLLAEDFLETVNSEYITETELAEEYGYEIPSFQDFKEDSIVGFVENRVMNKLYERLDKELR